MRRFISLDQTAQAVQLAALQRIGQCQEGSARKSRPGQGTGRFQSGGHIRKGLPRTGLLARLPLEPTVWVVERGAMNR